MRLRKPNFVNPQRSHNHKFAYDRLEAGLEMPRVFEVGKRLAVSVAIKELILIATCSEPEEWANQVWFLPLK